MKFVRGHLLSSRPLLSAHTAAVPETRESSKKGKKSKKSKKSKDLPTGEADPASAEPSRGAKPKRDKKSRRTKGKEPSQVKAASKADQNACVDSEDPSPAPYTVRRSTPLPKSAGSHEEKLDDSLTEYHNSSDEKLEFDPVRTWIECSLLCILYWSASWLIRTVISSF
ncbi:hypothetical protein C8Q79DRAFT_142176 [Trametes meyenii]|nr:hypothetical protein C8Q79DRAFT_142176 [Trametes meyenii]